MSEKIKVHEKSIRSFKDFYVCCEDQGICIHKDLLYQYHTDTWLCYVPDDWYGAVAIAGRSLREQPDFPLVNETIPETLIEPTGSSKLAQSALITVLNASREPKPIEGVYDFSTSNRHERDACADAERCFALVFDDLTSAVEYNDYITDRLATIFVDDQGTPIAISKHKGVNTTLSLVDMTVGGIPYPAGSLMVAEGSFYKEGCETAWNVVPASSIEGIGFIRLSGYATDDLTTRYFNFPDMDCGTSGDEMKLADISQLARRCAELEPPCILDS